MDKPRWIYANVVISKITYDQAIEKWKNNENVYLYYSEDFKERPAESMEDIVEHHNSNRGGFRYHRD